MKFITHKSAAGRANSSNCKLFKASTRFAFIKDMLKVNELKNSSGVTLIELMVVVSIIAIIAVIAVPQYGRFIAKNSVKKAANDLFQNMRLARTIAIKENRPYIMTFNETPNTYRIGFDGDSNGSLLDAGDQYDGAGPVRAITIPTLYGGDLVLGSANYTLNPPNGPNAMVIADAASFDFQTDGSSDQTGSIYLQETYRGYSASVELASSAGETNLYLWLGNADDASNTNWVELR
jgi:prepilin-type N-terminal cleavage/methylation domain-containing protein